jgi:hypothetical protein
MPVVVGFTGYAQSGKDTAAEFLVEKGFRRLAFADILRTSLYALNPIVDVDHSHVFTGGGELAATFDTTLRVRDIVDGIGWDRAKVEYPEIRQLLQRLGTEVGRELFGENFWVERVTRQIHNGDRVVITDVRFPNEEAAVHNLGGKVFRIVRPGNGAANTHASEQQVDRLFVDGVIPNNGSLAEYKEAVLSAVGVN